MRKLILGGLVAVLFSGCTVAHQQTKQEQALVGDQICHVKPAAKSPLPVEHFDYVTYRADQTVLMRGISQIDTKEGWMRYLLQAKAKWQASDGKLSYDFIDRLFKTAHSPQVAKIIEQSLELKEFDKEFISPCSNCGDHLDMKIKMKSPTRMTSFNTDTKETSQCRKLSAGEKTKEVKLIEKLVKEKGSIQINECFSL